MPYTLRTLPDAVQGGVEDPSPKDDVQVGVVASVKVAGKVIVI